MFHNIGSTSLDGPASGFVGLWKSSGEENEPLMHPEDPRWLSQCRVGGGVAGAISGSTPCWLCDHK